MFTSWKCANSLVNYNRPTANELWKIHSKLISSTAANYCSRQIKLDKDKEKRVLNILNNNDKEHLFRYPISKIRVEKINRWKAKNGQLSTIDDLLQLDGFGIKMLEKMCENILRYEDNPKSSDVLAAVRRPGVYTIPLLPVASTGLFKSLISIYPSVSTIAWSRIALDNNGPCNLSHWEYHDIGEKRIHVNELAQHVYHFVRSLPAADCYVMENPQVAQAAAPGGAEQVNINVQRAQIIAMLNYGFLSSCDDMLNNKKIFYLKKYLSSRVFDTLVGNERVSTEQVVTDMMRTVYNVEDWIETDKESSNNIENLTLRSSINFPTETREIYKKAEGYQREFLGQSLLIGMTFVRLCLLRTPESIAKVSPNTKISVESESS